MSDTPHDIQPDTVLQKIVAAIPRRVHPHLNIIGSLAAAYWLSERRGSFSVRTKDVDSVLSPRSLAPEMRSCRCRVGRSWQSA